MIAKYNGEYFRCCERDNNIIMLTAKEADGFRTIYSSDRRTILRREKIVSKEEVEEVFEISFLAKWKNRWLPVIINAQKNIGNISFWDDPETRRSLYGSAAAYAEKHNFDVMVSDRGVAHAWSKDVCLDEFTGFRVDIEHVKPEIESEKRKISKGEMIELYQKFVDDTEYASV